MNKEYNELMEWYSRAYLNRVKEIAEDLGTAEHVFAPGKNVETLIEEWEGRVMDTLYTLTMEFKDVLYDEGIDALPLSMDFTSFANYIKEKYYK